jgi:hypothetical protein
MKIAHLLILAAAALSSPAAYAAEASALVLVDDSLGKMRSGYTLSAAQSAALDMQASNLGSSLVESALNSGMSYGQAAGSALVGGLIAGAIIANAEQSAADDQILPLTRLFTPKEIESAFYAEVRSALKPEGIEDVRFIRVDSPSTDVLQRLPAADKDVTKLVIIGSQGMPVMLTADRRSLVLSVKIMQYAVSGQDVKQLSARKLTVISPPVASDTPDVALNEWVARGKDGVLSVLRDSMGLALRFGLSQDATVKSDKVEEVKFVNAAGIFAVPGKLLANADKRITVVDYKGNVAVMSADFVF